ncbi:FecR family protein [Chitinophaga sp. sic0106]|uniref:FecR family protein n=1 Tax=Chitinophaga sp. sic0106 TaxID=2854785 RepID=UPI001C43DEF8|nr:FecR family protein [Chitinophaga sp. sic0106]MBV7533015.1 DUF4974 domain-containing protein [Chitinophaga sp. sic0106]
MDRLSAKEILDRYKSGAATPEERVLVEDWITFGDFAPLQLTEKELERQVDAMGKGLPLVVYGSARNWWRAAAAAATLLVLVAGGWYFYAGKSAPKKALAVKTGIPEPGTNRATLTLANGHTIPLSSSQSGVVVNATKLSYGDGSVITKENSSGSHPLASHTVTTPRGGQYQVILPDGTHVWLNAGSSLKFPESFEQTNSRSVALTGEAYFEVAANSHQPFIVTAPGQQVEVLGTHFNINCYEDEKVARTTLLQGAVKVTAGNYRKSGILKPGQQAMLSGNDLQIVAGSTEEAIAWKNGYFDFRNEPLENILRQVSRWYDVDIVYEDNAPSQELLYGRISRSKSLSAVLKVLELSGNISFKLEGQKLTVIKK